MKAIYFIDKIELTENGLVVKGSKQLAHLRQGDLDGACGVYSMMMCLVIEKIIKRHIITDVPETLKRNTSDGRLVRYFLEKKGMIINGYHLDELEADLLVAFKKKVNPVYKDDNVLKEIIKQLNDNHPVEIEFTRVRTFGHFVVVVGFREEETFTDLYCLDPGFPMNDGQMWNNTLRIDTASSSKFNCFNMQENRNVCIKATMVFKKKK